MFGLNNIINIAVISTISKFPDTLKNEKDKFTLFELSEIVANELSEKQGELFIKDFTKDFVNNVKDLALDV